MPNFEFEAKNPEGQIVTGKVSADNRQMAEKILWQNKLAVIQIIEKNISWIDAIVSMFGFVSVRDISIFTRSLATMIESGFPLLEALGVLALQTQNKTLENAISMIISDLTAGESFSSALTKHEKIFSRVYISVVKSGEKTGKLPLVLNNLANGLEKDYAFVSKLRGAMSYPLFLVFAMIIIGAIMMINVIPQLQEIFKDAGADLPWTTVAIITLADYLKNYWWIFFPVFFGGIIAIVWFFKSPQGKPYWSIFQLRIPVLAPLNQLIYAARFTRTFGLLNETGIPILEALDITAEVMNNNIYEESLRNAAKEVERGIPLSTPISRSSFFPIIIGQMMRVGEKTGKLDKILNSLAVFYETEVDNKIKTISSLIEPVLIIIIGMAVAIVVFGIIVPIYNLANIY
ncbi:type II secretion system F family protein [Patescibacteria group bacterium]